MDERPCENMYKKKKLKRQVGGWGNMEKKNKKIHVGGGESMENHNKGEKHKEVDESAWKNMKRGEREKKKS